MLELIGKIKDQAGNILESNLTQILNDLNTVASEVEDGKIPELTANVKVSISKEGTNYAYKSKVEWSKKVKHSDETDEEVYDGRQLTFKI